jgi:hypothetical protein
MTRVASDEMAQLAEAFRASRRATEAWERAHPLGIEAALAWIEQLREAFGDPPVDRTPTRGDDWRI